MTTDHCKGCKYRKWRRRPTQTQQIRMFMITCVIKPDETTYNMAFKLVSEFCKVGKVNLHGDCSSYKRQWWRRKVRGLWKC